jgi:hypothetical protein
MKKKKTTDSDKLIITELMLVKADWGRTFVAEIYRETTPDGVPIVHGTVVVNEGNIWSSAETQEELGKYLDDICFMKFHMGLNSISGIKLIFHDMCYFLN